MADPTPEEVAAAIATLNAFEHAQHPVAAPVEPVKPSKSPADDVVADEPAAESAAPAPYAASHPVARKLHELADAVDAAIASAGHEYNAEKAAIEKVLDAARKVGTI